MEEIEAKKSKHKWVFWAIAIVLSIVALGIYGATKLYEASDQNLDVFQSVLEDKNESTIVNENFSTDTISGQPSEKEPEKGMLESENYMINSMSIGGNVMMIPDDENQVLQISNIKSEAFLNDKKGEVKLVITWQTNKLAISEVEYSKRDGKDLKIAKEESYGFNHSAIIAGLEPGTSYIYRISCKDRLGNEEKSGHFGMYAPPRIVSIFSLMTTEMEKIFGWALK